MWNVTLQPKNMIYVGVLSLTEQKYIKRRKYFVVCNNIWICMLNLAHFYSNEVKTYAERVNEKCHIKDLNV